MTAEAETADSEELDFAAAIGTSAATGGLDAAEAIGLAATETSLLAGTWLGEAGSALAGPGLASLPIGSIETVATVGVPAVPGASNAAIISAAARFESGVSETTRCGPESRERAGKLFTFSSEALSERRIPADAPEGTADALLTSAAASANEADFGEDIATGGTAEIGRLEGTRDERAAGDGGCAAANPGSSTCGGASADPKPLELLADAEGPPGGRASPGPASASSPISA